MEKNSKLNNHYQVFHITWFPGNVQLSSVTQPCPTLWDRVNRSTPGLPVHHQLPESTETHVPRVNDAIPPSYPLLSPSPPALSLSQHQDYQLHTKSSAGFVACFVFFLNTFTFCILNSWITKLLSASRPWTGINTLLPGADCPGFRTGEDCRLRCWCWHLQ